MRYSLVDSLRGVAIVGMILFHTYYVLLYVFDVTQIGAYENVLQSIAKVFAILFISLAGLSFALAEKKYKEKIVEKYIPKIALIGLYALIISLVTYVGIFAQRISFGILHFFVFAFTFLLIFRHVRYANLIFAFIGLIFYIFPIQSESMFFIPFGAIPSWYFSADFYPLLPYVSYMLFGYVLGLWLIDAKLENLLSIENTFLVKILSFLGRHSLTIYMLHVPFIFSLIWTYFFLIS